MNCYLRYFIYCEVKILFNYVGSLIIKRERTSRITSKKKEKKIDRQNLF